jgi:hypothetical protein
MVRAPLVELGSLPGGDHDRKFAQSGRQRAVEANKIADMKEQYAKRGAARIGVEWPDVDFVVARRVANMVAIVCCSGDSWSRRSSDKRSSECAVTLRRPATKAPLAMFLMN